MAAELRPENENSTVCGVKVLTWGTSPDAGNGMLHAVDAMLFGGNVGHATVQVTFPNNAKGKELLQYCNDHKVPCEEKTIVTLDENGKEKFKTEVIQVYWSWWPKPGSNPEFPHLLEPSV